MPRILFPILRKDLREITSNWKVWLPMVIVPLFVVVVMPSLVFYGLTHGGAAKTAKDIDPFMRMIATRYVFAGEIQKAAFVLLNFVFPLVFLLIPLITSTIIAANTFAGEKEHKTLETLLYTPIRLEELFLAKVLGTFLPVYVVTLFAFLVFSVVAHIGAGEYIQGFLLLQPRCLVLILLVCPALIVLGLTFTVWVPARSSTFQEAQQLGGLIVLPLIGLLMGQFGGLFLLDIPQLILLGLGLGGVDAILIVWVARHFTYENLLR